MAGIIEKTTTRTLDITLTVAIYLTSNRWVTKMDWDNEFIEDINQALEIMIDQLHDYVNDNEHYRAEELAETIRQYMVDMT